MNKYKDYNKAILKGYWCHNLKYCIDITEDWIGMKKKKNTVIKYHIGDTFKYKGKEYYIDGHDIVIEYKNGEEEFANILSTITDKRIELFPRFNVPENKKTTDSKIGKEYIDFKIVTSETDKFIYGNIADSKHQSKNYLFYIKGYNISLDLLEYQIDNAFRRFKEVNIIGIYFNNTIKIYKKRTFDAKWSSPVLL